MRSLTHILVHIFNFFFFTCRATTHFGPRRHRSRFLDHTKLDTHSVGILLQSYYVLKLPFLHGTKQTQMRSIHVLSGVRTRDPKVQDAADLALDRKATGICHIYDMLLVFALTVDIS